MPRRVRASAMARKSRKVNKREKAVTWHLIGIPLVSGMHYPSQQRGRMFIA